MDLFGWQSLKDSALRRCNFCLYCNCSPSAAPKAMQGDFRRTVQAHCNDARTSTHGGVASHVVILPSSRPHPSWQHRLQLDRDRSRETKLATVRMAAQHQIEIGVGSLTI